MSASSFILFLHGAVTTALYTLSLHDALPIWGPMPPRWQGCGLSISARSVFRSAAPCATLPGRKSGAARQKTERAEIDNPHPDRKSTRLNSSHTVISYAVFCLKKKKE